jgi:antitoxin VapB
MTTGDPEADTAEPEKEVGRDDKDALRRELRSVQGRFGRRPVLDDRSADEIIGYDENGLPA